MGSGSGPARLILVGCGRMGGALLAGWQASGLVSHATVAEPAGLPAGVDPAGVNLLADAADLPAQDPAHGSADMLVLAVKPQMMEAVMPAARRVADAGVPVLSIAAGLPLAWFAERLSPGARIVRAMPNTPAAIGRGVTALVAGPAATPGDCALATRLMAAVGSVEWLSDEALMDPVTALSGGGPAYVFLLMEAMAEAGAAAGLDPDQAMRLARETVIGAAALAADDTAPAATLRRNVTSPGGTTEAALQVLMGEGGLPERFRDAVAGAVARARTLAAGGPQEPDREPDRAPDGAPE